VTKIKVSYDEYVRRASEGTDACIFCETDWINLDWGSPEWDYADYHDKIKSHVLCKSCGGEWDESYRLVSFKNEKEGEDDTNIT
jgi:hypothetical protein